MTKETPFEPVFLLEDESIHFIINFLRLVTLFGEGNCKAGSLIDSHLACGDHTPSALFVAYDDLRPIGRLVYGGVALSSVPIQFWL